jgi:hypothetical protein
MLLCMGGLCCARDKLLRLLPLLLLRLLLCRLRRVLCCNKPLLV